MGDPSRAPSRNHGGLLRRVLGIALGPWQALPDSPLFWNLSRLSSVIHGILWGQGKRGVQCRSQGQASVGGGLGLKSCTPALSSRLVPTLPPPATVIRLGVAMVTGEVT